MDINAGFFSNLFIRAMWKVDDLGIGIKICFQFLGKPTKLRAVVVFGSSSTFQLQNEGTCVLWKMGFGGHFLVPHARRALAFFSRKHFWHSLKKHVVGFKVVFKNQSSFFSETSSLNPINIKIVCASGFDDPPKSKCIFLRMVNLFVWSYPQKRKGILKATFQGYDGTLVGVMHMHSLVDFSVHMHSLVTSLRVLILQNGQAC